MSETQQDGNPIEAPKAKHINMEGIARAVLEEKPSYVLVADAHITSEPQDVAASLVESLSRDPSFIHDDVGFYVEALYGYAKPESGDFSGSVIAWDDHKSSETNYRGTIQRAIDAGVAVHGIDLDKRVDSEGEERMVYCQGQIEKGTEPIKVLLIGAGHIWNNPKRSADLMHRLGKRQWIIVNEKAYIPPGYNQVITANISQSVATDRKYIIAKYDNQPRKV
jgi:hypothetical protein